MLLEELFEEAGENSAIAAVKEKLVGLGWRKLVVEPGNEPDMGAFMVIDFDDRYGPQLKKGKIALRLDPARDASYIDVTINKGAKSRIISLSGNADKIVDEIMDVFAEMTDGTVNPLTRLAGENPDLLAKLKARRKK